MFFIFFLVVLTYPAISLQLDPPVVSITEFGGIGDGTFLNTGAFQRASASFLGDNKGGTLYIPKGVWLTGCFNLTSFMTLYIEQGAVILASQNFTDWPLIDPLPSYGTGRELPGRRYSSLIHGQGLTNVTITGNNGTIDGQGEIWWQAFHKKHLHYSRGCLVELINSSNIVISKITLLNSPMWTVHPVYCNNVVIQGLTILAPLSSPNTDGINPDSSSNVLIKDCYVRNGDDAIAIKSGWDEYGILFGKPSTNISITNVSIDGSHGISIGSEMSGGVSNILVDGIFISNSPKQAIHVKTAVGRGGYIENVHVKNIHIRDVRTAFSFTALYGQHPDHGYDPEAYPRVENITVENVSGMGISSAGKFTGLEEVPFRSVCLINIALDRGAHWKCSNVSGFSNEVYPKPCVELQTLSESMCYHG